MLLKKHFATALLSACVTLGSTSGFAEESMPGKGITVRPITGTIIEERFQHGILYRGLQALGYEIADAQEVEYQTIHLALGTGDGDFTASHWNSLHHAFYEESGGAEVMTKVGNLIDGALQGYLVDTASYEAGVKNIGQLTDAKVAARFDADADGKADLAGCAPGWGCERVIEHQLDAYGLRKHINHNQGSYNAIIAETIAREAAGDPVIYYTWTPYWVSGVLVPGKNVQWLEVPKTELPDGQDAPTTYEGKNLGFPVDSIRIIASNDFLQKNPAAAKLFELAVLNVNDVSEQNQRIQNGEDSLDDIEKHISEWIANNQSTFDGWVAEARAAAQ